MQGGERRAGDLIPAALAFVPPLQPRVGRQHDPRGAASVRLRARLRTAADDTQECRSTRRGYPVARIAIAGAACDGLSDLPRSGSALLRSGELPPGGPT